MTSAEPPKYIKILLMLKKKDEVSDEFFHQYWRGNHVDLAIANKKFTDKVIRYNQVSSLRLDSFIVQTYRLSETPLIIYVFEGSAC